MPHPGTIWGMDVDRDTQRRRQLFEQRVADHDNELPGYRDVWGHWRSQLLLIGGSDVVPPVVLEWRIVDLMLHACQHAGADALFVAGEPSNCHDNVANLWVERVTACGHEVASAWTGYALSDDGLWRQHSWAMTTDGRVIETTVGRTVYMGVPLEDSA